MKEIIDIFSFGLAIAIGIGLIAVPTVLSVWYNKRKRKLKTPGIDANWKLVGSLANITLYPLKSGRGIDLDEALCTQFGLSEIRNDDKLLLRDRFFMLFREDTGEMLTALTLQKIFQFSMNSDSSNSFKLSYPGHSDLIVHIPKGGNKVTRMWRKEPVECWDCGDEAAFWFTNILRGQNAVTKTSVRLGYWPQTGIRRNLVGTYKDLYNDKAYNNVTNLDSGAFSDITSYMLMTSSSMDEMNRKLDNMELSPKQFRPNFYVQTNEPPFSDLKWKWVKIGDVVFKFIKGCKRCSLTTYKPDTGEKCPNNEPLRTLKKIEEAQVTVPIKEGPMMGIHLGFVNSGSVHTGDPVYVIDES